jgi:uncharacterized membrane protein YjjP (DUF1212 family)
LRLRCCSRMQTNLLLKKLLEPSGRYWMSCIVHPTKGRYVGICLCLVFAVCSSFFRRYPLGRHDVVIPWVFSGAVWPLGGEIEPLCECYGVCNGTSRIILCSIFSLYLPGMNLCFFSMVLAALVQLLPGLSLTLGVSEMQAKAHVTGTSRYPFFSVLSLYYKRDSESLSSRQIYFTCYLHT